MKKSLEKKLQETNILSFLDSLMSSIKVRDICIICKILGRVFFFCSLVMSEQVTYLLQDCTQTSSQCTQAKSWRVQQMLS